MHPAVLFVEACRMGSIRGDRLYKKHMGVHEH